MPTQSPFAASPLLAHVAGLSRNELERLQLIKLRRQLDRLYATSPYYRERMDSVGLKPESITSLDVFKERFPTSTKADFLADQLAHPPFGARLGIPRDQVALVNMTGGTSGQGQEIYGRSQRDIHMQGYLHALPWFLAGLRPGHMAINCVPAGGMTTGGWGPGEGLRIVGATGFHVGGSLSTDAKIDLMLKLGAVNFIYASTNYLHTLTDALLRRGMEPRQAFPHMQALFIAAEGYPIEWAQKIEEHWGCHLAEGYGSTQCAGFAGSTCDQGVVTKDGQRGLIHLFEWETMFEIVDPETMEPTPSGEVGEMVVTNLSVEGSPVMRFRTGDAARFVAHGDTGTGWGWNAIECGTIGRFDDMMKIRGNNVWPSAIDAAVFAHTDVADYAGRVYTTDDGKTEIEVRLALADQAALTFSPEQRQNLFQSVRTAIKERNNIWVTLIEVQRGELPEFAYKARRWKDERQAGYRL
ncbi:MAG TPA: AMP-binding protein [Alphaproteobacteria bacterium]|jgi:phenylacetate-CoA ligase|nr:AMP-binding protein [Alphaproteobacteria bacterium]